MLAGMQQQLCFWPSYNNCEAGYEHDLIVVHRNGLGLPNPLIHKKYGKTIMLNKINEKGEDVPHKAFGAYRFAFNKFKDDYDIFIFISDDVVLKRDNWVKDIVTALKFNEKLGFGASQIFNGGKSYPHESHLRAPFWFAKSQALKETKWEFEHDHEGEMRIGDQLTEAGYFGIQVGNKLDLGFDSTEPNHITQLLERAMFNDKSPMGKYDNLGELEEKYFNNLIDENIEIVSPYPHIGVQKIFHDLETFDGLVYLPSLEIAKKYVDVNNIGHEINIVKWNG